MIQRYSRPEKRGLYHPEFEHESCGVGFIADLHRRPSHKLLQDSLQELSQLHHRGGIGSDNVTGDGAGVLTSIPDIFLRKVTSDLFTLPSQGKYATGMCFLPVDKGQRQKCQMTFTQVAEKNNLRVLGWREVPTNNQIIGEIAKRCEPAIYQVFMDAPEIDAERRFDQMLYLTRKQATSVLQSRLSDELFYVCSLHRKNIVYKGMLTPSQLPRYYLDLQDEDYTCFLSVLHFRFSTNTYPSWDKAHPLRMLAHNGEINTIKGNRNYMRSREGVLTSDIFGSQLQTLFPIIEKNLTDSGEVDNVLEFFLLNDIPVTSSLMMMIPEAWQEHTTMDRARRDMYEYFSTLIEPWDGPASIVFTDGDSIGAVVDRNGLRPSRYYLTKDDRVVMSSEVGGLPFAPDEVVEKGSLQFGKIFFIDFNEKRIIHDEEIKNRMTARHPYGKWLSEHRIHMADIPVQKPIFLSGDELERNSAVFGYTKEHENFLLRPILEKEKDPLGSMGNDTPLAVLSRRPRLVYEYFKQLFAQVTNPAIDSIREKSIMSLGSYIGPQGNILKSDPKNCNRLYLDHPILSNEECASLKKMDSPWGKSHLIDLTYPVKDGRQGLEKALKNICKQSEEVVDAGHPLIILSDRAVSKDRVPISPLLAGSAVHHYLVRQAKRTKVGLMVESGEPRETHHFCCLFGFGVDAVNPYLALDILEKISRDDGRQLTRTEVTNLFKAVMKKGILKVLAKMGISTLDSYKGAQIFEIVGIHSSVVKECFPGAISRLEGNSFDGLAAEALERHSWGFPSRNRSIDTRCRNSGDYQWRSDGELHMWNPVNIALFQSALRNNDYGLFKQFSQYTNERITRYATLRGALKFIEVQPIPQEEVESEAAIMRRFATGAMSFGSISQEAHETLAIAMNRIGAKSNTGEGGELRSRYTPLPNGDSKRSKIKQIASGRFGVTLEYLSSADEIQIKIAQGAKPGEGGELPGHKVSPLIAQTRHSTPGVGLISPPPHHDIYSIEDLAQLIFDLKNANPSARISVKLVSEMGVGTIAAGVVKGHADHIVIAGHDGGTGASPLTGIKHAGLPWELGIAETHQTLVLSDLRSRVVVQTDGQVKTGRDVVIAGLLGAEECGFATSALIAMGCIMMRKCEQNTCPVGIATQDKRLREKFTGDPEQVVRFFTFLSREVREIMATLGVRKFDDLVGRTDLLTVDKSHLCEKAQQLDLSPLLFRPETSASHSGVYCCIPQDHGIDRVLDRTLIEEVQPTIREKKPVELFHEVNNANRTVGSMLSNELLRHFGPYGLKDDTVRLNLRGSGGQSFGAWLLQGVSIYLTGDANDYVGKGLSGGKIVIRAEDNAPFSAADNMIVGNVCFYGAISGKAFINGRAAERFCVRNSGIEAIVEGVGAHGCEYMTGGCVVVLGSVDRNFAAGMSGGVAYLWRGGDDLFRRVNTEMVEIQQLNEDDYSRLHGLIKEHIAYTNSARGRFILSHWEDEQKTFAKIISPVFQKIMEKTIKKEEYVDG